MRICAVILDYRGADRTQACLCSLAGQGIMKALIVDNSAEPDATRSIVAMVGRLRTSGVDFDLQLITPGSNLGFAGGVNLALSEDDMSDHPHDAYLLLNNDAIAKPDMVARLAVALAESGTGMVAPAVVDATGKPQPMLWYQRFFGLLTAYPLPGSFPYLSGCCLLVSREMLENGRLFDEDFFMYGEDTLLGWRLARAGKKPLHVGGALVYHDGAGSSRRGQWFYEYHMARAHVLLAMKTLRHPIEMPLLLASKGIGLCLRALWRSLRFGSLVPLKAFGGAWRRRDIRVP